MTIRRLLSFLLTLLLSMFTTATVHGQEFWIDKQGEEIYQRQLRRRMLPRERNQDAYTLLENLKNEVMTTGVISYPGDITVEVMNDRDLNAFAMPGYPNPHVVFNSGLLNLIVRHASQAGLGGVMAHELTHLAHKHATSGMKMAIPLAIGLTVGNIVSRTSIGRDHPIAVGGGMLGFWGVGNGLMSFYSRRHEKDSDEEAVKVLLMARYDVNGYAELFQAMEQELQKHGRIQRPNFLTKIFASHPELDDRIKKIFAAAERQPTPTAGDSEEFIRIRERLAGRSRYQSR